MTDTPPGPWRRALRRLRQDPAALAAFAVLAIIVLACALAPVYARNVAHTNPFRSSIDATFSLHGQIRPVLATEPSGLGVTPIGPGWRRAYLLGADGQGRDVAARLLFGGRLSLVIAAGATVLTLVLAALVGLLAGAAGGVVDAVLSRLMDMLWAFPVYLLAISLAIVLINSNLVLGPFTITGDSLLLPVFIIGIIYVPYVARPLRARVRELRGSVFVLAAIGIGAPPARILLREILPNALPVLIVFAPLIMALSLLTEAALSFLSIGVQSPAASWGTIIQDGQALIYTRPWVAVAPGIAIVACVVALNVLGDALRDALDPRVGTRGR